MKQHIEDRNYAHAHSACSLCFAHVPTLDSDSHVPLSLQKKKWNESLGDT
ncbi:unnamed protein product [Periconia digitata]|uniref:Uncharacterized protein n=1 Tax=Periconia digitata TaxID=1303443 RepID=A0A9W4UQB4_9PLEO|nr:unnamed protein product [Periconia digitata]